MFQDWRGGIQENEQTMGLSALHFMAPSVKHPLPLQEPLDIPDSHYITF